MSSTLVACSCIKANHRNHAAGECDGVTVEPFDVCGGCFEEDKRNVRTRRNKQPETPHIMKHWRVYNRDGVGIRWKCSCGHRGTQTYRNDETGLGVDHARKAFHVHASYADREKARA